MSFLASSSQQKTEKFFVREEKSFIGSATICKELRLRNFLTADLEENWVSSQLSSRVNRGENLIIF